MHNGLKLYKRDYVNDNFTVSKEIFVSEMAEEFNLYAPEYAVIDINHKDLKGFYADNELKMIDEGCKFCSKFQQPSIIFNSLASLKFVKSYDIANLFAFDTLITNVDRGGFRNKPNLLINDDEMILIDHEQTLPFINSKNLDKVNYYAYLRNYQYKKHVVYKYLQSMRSKEDMFDEFSEMINLLNVNKLMSLFDDFDTLKIKYGERDDFFIFLSWIKNNRKPIVDHLIRIIN